MSNDNIIVNTNNQRVLDTVHYLRRWDYCGGHTQTHSETEWRQTSQYLHSLSGDEDNNKQQEGKVTNTFS